MKIIKAGAAVAVAVSIGLFFLGPTILGGLLGLSVLFVFFCQMALAIVYRNLAPSRKKAAWHYVHFEDTTAGKFSGFLFGYAAAASLGAIAASATAGAIAVAVAAPLMAFAAYMSWFAHVGTKRIFHTEAEERNEIFADAQKAREKAEAEKARREKAEAEAKAERDEKERQAKEREKARQEKAALDEAMRRADSF